MMEAPLYSAIDKNIYFISISGEFWILIHSFDSKFAYIDFILTI